MTRVTQLIHDAGKYLLISVYPLPTHPTHNFIHTNGGNLETLPGWPKKLQHNRPARSAGQLWQTAPCYKEYNLTKPDPVWYNTSIKLCPSTSIQEIPFTTKRKCSVAWLVSCHGHTDWRHVLGRLTTRKNFPHPWPHCKPGFNPLIIGPVRLA